MRILLPTLVLAFVLAQPLAGQRMPLKSTPTPTVEQMRFLPSLNVGMAGLHVASDDSLADPFRNPAIAPGDRPFRVTASPVVYHTTRRLLGATTLPVSATLVRNGWFGAFAFATQELEDDAVQPFVLPHDLTDALVEDEERTNTYLLGSLGHRFASGVSVGVQLLRGELGILEGTRRQYTSSLGVLQEGEIDGMMLGLAHDLGPAGRLEGTLARTRVAMENEVVRWRWLPPATPEGRPRTEVWSDVEGDHSRTLEGRLRYTRPVERIGMRLGVLAGIVDRRQEQVPRYDLVNVPRDPGSGRSWRFGIGTETTWGVPLQAGELVFDGGTYETRALADSTYVTPSGALVRPGDPAADSRFSFHNWRIAGGMRFHTGPGTVQLALAVHHYRFTLAQDDHLFEKLRERSESWTELLPAGSVRIVLGPVDLGYSLSLTMKGLAPCNPFTFRTECKGREEVFWDTTLPVAPTLPANLPDFRVVSHVVTVSVR